MKRGTGDAADATGPDVGPVRLDKWLWAARFFRTRTLCKEAIEAGHVRIGGERSKVGRVVHQGMLIAVRQGWDEREVQVMGLSNERRGAPEAQKLYTETAASREAREQAALLRAAASDAVNPEKPSKKQRRMLDRFKRDHGWK